MIKWVPRAIPRMGELLPAPQSSIRCVLVQSTKQLEGHTLSVNVFVVSALSPVLRSRCKKNAYGKTADYCRRAVCAVLLAFAKKSRECRSPIPREHLQFVGTTQSLSVEKTT